MRWALPVSAVNVVGYVFTPPQESISPETKPWEIHHDAESRLHGYLVIGTLREARYEFADISPEGSAEFGGVVAIATRAIQVIIKPEHGFAGRYGLVPGKHLHLHIVPVYDWLEERVVREERYCS